MTFETNYEYDPLVWVKTEIDVTLNEVKKNLASYLDNPNEKKQLSSCIYSLDQVRGSLELLALHSAKVDVEKLKTLLEGVSDEKNTEQTIEDVRQILDGVSQIMQYLQDIDKKPDEVNTPVFAMPSIEELRFIQIRQLYSDQSFLVALNKPLLDGNIKSESNLSTLVRSLRTEYQLSLVSWLRNSDRDSAQGMLKVIEKIENISYHSQRLWAIAIGVLDALVNSGLPVTDTLKKLFGQLDRQIKRLFDEEEIEMAKKPDTDLMKNMLVLLAQSNVSTPKTQELKAFYHLDTLVEKANTDIGESANKNEYNSIIVSIFEGVKRELTATLAELSQRSESDTNASESIENALAMAKRVIDTFSVIELTVLRDKMDVLRQTLTEAVNRGAIDERRVIEISNILNYVINSVTDVNYNFQAMSQSCSAEESYQLISVIESDSTSQKEFEIVQQAAIDEALVDIDVIKKYILDVSSIDNGQNVHQSLSHTLENMIGIFKFFNFPVDDLTTVHRFVNDVLLDDEHPFDGRTNLEPVAEVITGIEHYLVCQKNNQNSSDALDISKRATNILKEVLNNREFSAQYDSAKHVLMREMTEEIVNVKNALLLYEDSKQTESLVHVPEAISQIKSGLLVLENVVGVNYLKAVHDYILSHVLEDQAQKIEQNGLVALTDVVTGFSNYLTSISLPEAQTLRIHKGSADFFQNIYHVSGKSEALDKLKEDYDTIHQAILFELNNTLENIIGRLQQPAQLQENSLEVVAKLKEVKTTLLMLEITGDSSFLDEIIRYMEKVLSTGMTELSQLDAVKSMMSGLIDFFKNDSPSDSGCLPDFSNEIEKLLDMPSIEEVVIEPVAVDEESYWQAMDVLAQELIIDITEAKRILGQAVEEPKQYKALIALIRSLYSGVLLMDMPESSVLKIVHQQFAYQLNDATCLAESSMAALANIFSAFEVALRNKQHVDLNGIADNLTVLNLSPMTIVTEVTEPPMSAEWKEAVADSEAVADAPQDLSGEQPLMDSQLAAVELAASAEWQESMADDEVTSNVGEEVLEAVDVAMNEVLASIEKASFSTDSSTLSLEMFDSSINWLVQAKGALVVLERNADVTSVELLIQYFTELTRRDGLLADVEFLFCKTAIKELVSQLQGEHVESVDDKLRQLLSGEFLVSEFQESETRIETSETVADILIEQEDDDDDDDFDIFDIFLEEAEELVGTIAEYYPCWRINTSDEASITQIRRAFHTIKGSGRVAGVNRIGELAWSAEHMLNQMIEGVISPSEQMVHLMDQVIELLPNLLAQCRSSGCDIEANPAVDLLTANIHEMAEKGELAMDMVQVVDELDRPDGVICDVIENENSDEDGDEDDIFNIFLEEAQELLGTMAEHYTYWQANQNDEASLIQVRRAFHTMKGSGRVAGVNRIGELAWSVEHMLNQVIEGAIRPSEKMIHIMDQVLELLPTLLEQCQSSGRDIGASPLMDSLTANAYEVAGGQSARLDSTVQDVQSGTADKSDDSDITLISIFRSEAAEHIAVIREFIAHGRTDFKPKITMSIVRAWHTLTGASGMAGFSEICELAGAAEALVQWAYEGDVILDMHQLNAMDDAVTEIFACLPLLDKGESVLTNNAKLVANLRSFWVEADEDDLVQDTAATKSLAGESSEETIDFDDEDLDETREIFLEEAGELLEQLDEVMLAWRLEPRNLQFIKEFERLIHTLKGGARLCRLMAMGNLSHSMETLLTEMAAVKIEVTIESLDVLRLALDRLQEMREQVIARKPLNLSLALIYDIEKIANPEKAMLASEAEVENETQAVSEEDAISLQISNRKSVEQIRVTTELLEELSNGVAEISINRSQLSQKINVYEANISDMRQTINRLRTQLRKMEIETEAQILSRSEEASAQGIEFDSLEFDRFTNMQQISRSLLETASDLDSIYDQFQVVSSESDTLLIQQARINSKIQSGLTKTRLVPFSKIVPRMSRLIRQTANELDKKVEVHVTGEDDEIDRHVLDQISGPLEHIMRNAVGHGIEPKQARSEKNKPEIGAIQLSFKRVNNDVLIGVSDDGGGLNIDAIRKKAIERKLMSASSKLKDEEILQFVLESGFSTAKEVTQISGRGVGLDVVANVVKQLGGHLHIESKYGEGTTFSIRLPVDLTTSRALFLQSGENEYAVPFSGIVDVVKVTIDKLTSENGKWYYQHSGRNFEVKNLQSILHRRALTEDKSSSISMLLFDDGGYRMAISVDAFKGSREILIKPAGVQLSNVRGIMGATIMGDGNVVLVLDLPGLMRVNLVTSQLEEQANSLDELKKQDNRLTVMVVDDSITVRKVTSKLLKRHQVDVMTATDGVDALQKLHEQLPDVMLLDIEMPRMDGYELASVIRNTEHLKHLPIIMITSRIGDKHRNKAIEIGVNEYMGKPYQEDDLLMRIRDLAATSRTFSPANKTTEVAQSQRVGA